MTKHNDGHLKYGAQHNVTAVQHVGGEGGDNSSRVHLFFEYISLHSHRNLLVICVDFVVVLLDVNTVIANGRFKLLNDLAKE